MKVTYLFFGCLAMLGSLDAVAIQPRINKGENANPGEFPYHVSIVTKLIEFGNNRCNGVLVSKNSVLTTAYCLTGAVSATIGLGVSDLESPILSIKSEIFDIHDDYNPRTFENNLAIIKLPISVDGFIETIRLPSLSHESYTFVGHIGIVTGYETLAGPDSDIRAANILQLTKVKIVDLQQCQIFYGRTVANDKTLCALGHDADDQGPCPNDHGSPLIVSEEDGDTLVGVVSYISNIGCFSGHPSGFVRIGAYIGWISEHAEISPRH